MTKILTRTLPRTGMETSALGMGCWAVGGEWTLAGAPAGWGRTDERESLAAIDAAFGAGIRLFDTAANYGAGLSERLLGQALRGRRQHCVVSTKFGFVVHEDEKRVSWPRPGDGTAAQRVADECEQSLRRLGTDFIDVYFFHIWDYDPVMAVEVREALEGLVQAGKIRSYGWSTDDPTLAAILAAGPHCSAMQCTANVVHDNPAMIQLCERENLGAFIKSPLAMGFLSGKYDGTTQFDGTDVRSGLWAQDTFQKPVAAKLEALRDILTSGGRTLVQGSLAWLWARSGSTLPIPGIRTPAQAVENAGAMELGPLTPEQMAEIETLARDRESEQ